MRSTFFYSAGLFVVVTAALIFSDRSVSPRPGEGAVVEASLLPVGAEVTANPSPAAAVPEAAPRVALQAGHWLAAEAPDELAGIRTNGTRGGGKAEWEVTLEIAQRTAEILEEAGYIVDVLPATVPPAYRADLFISIHADGHNDTSIHGFRVGAPRRDRTGGRSGEFAEVLASEYLKATQLRRIPVVTRRMENYYAFNSRRFVHSIHPQTAAVIIETGFLTNAADRRIIVDAPARSAEGIAAAVKSYLPHIPAPAPVPPPIMASN